MKLKEFMPFIGDDHVEIIDEVYHGDVLFKGLVKDVVDQEFLEWDVVTVHGFTSCPYTNEDEDADEDEYEIDFVMVFVKNPEDV